MSPCRTIFPLSGGVSQFIVLKRVLFPQPLGPMIQITSPLQTLSDTFFKAFISPNLYLFQEFLKRGVSSRKTATFSNI